VSCVQNEMIWYVPSMFLDRKSILKIKISVIPIRTKI
jgi:hypothetical protein